MSEPSLHLVSFKVCPFVQRATIALNEKQVPYTVTHLTPGVDQPDWFKAVSPLNQVPVLIVGGKPVFESGVIVEYLEEVYAPALHPADPLTKAHHRAWMEFCSGLLGKHYQMLTTKDPDAFASNQAALQQGLQRVGGELASTLPFFAGEAFSLVDAIYAPLFMRLDLLKRYFSLELVWDARVQAWSDALLAKPSVQQSVVADFEDVFLRFVRGAGGHINQLALAVH